MLFIEDLGWDRYAGQLKVALDGESIVLSGIAEKRGMAVFLCAPLPDGRIPDYNVRRIIERAVTRHVAEHIILYADAAKTVQIWQWVRREPGKPDASREQTFYSHQTGEALIQRLNDIVFNLDEEEALTVTQVAARAHKAFDVEKITKQFYERFKAEHAALFKFLKGIPDEELQRWYISVMLNRLMFIYFIQKKGFLHGDADYLRARLAQSKKHGKDLFYRDVLCPLFFEGFAKPEGERAAEVNDLLGQVPYLNGGLFARHYVETLHGETIQIADAAFEHLFAFFEEYHWHLDERPLRQGNEINPDVLGYIFEKYVNQKQMGAYYTKEDITEYISKNTVLPYLFDAARREHRAAFEGDRSIWSLAQADPDRYIYDAVKHGVSLPLPDDIAAGLNDVSQRSNWNKPAPESHALPTEIWREVVARRHHYESVRGKLRNGEVRDINDFITLNLNIRQFAQDVITNCETPELLRALWHAIEHVTVLDPTCGSGAFLFAALNILEPLYEACLDRMQAFIDDLLPSPNGGGAGGGGAQRFSGFRKLLDRVAEHPSRRYFILKSIMVNNLYGVDIMEEATEICKLRLFLKLVAQIERAQDIEPLPDIDFNIRAGNTLVGFAAREDVRRALSQTSSGQGKLIFEDTDQALKRIDESAELADRAFRLFQDMQTERGMSATDFAHAKQDLRQRLNVLNEELNRALAHEYGVPLPDEDAPTKSRRPRETLSQASAYDKWLKSHQPFHWFVEFYGILQRGGFDVIIGNPPWKEYAATKKEYAVQNYDTLESGNLYALATERSAALRHSIGYLSFIVQLPMTSSSRMKSLRDLLRRASSRLYLIPCDDRPGKLFDGLQHCRSVIFVSKAGQHNKVCQLATTKYLRWLTAARPLLFETITFVGIAETSIHSDQFPKYSELAAIRVFNKLQSKSSISVGSILRAVSTTHFIFYQESTQYWVKATTALPHYSKDGHVGAPAHGRYLYFKNAQEASVIGALLNSSLFYIYFIAYGDCFHLSDKLVSELPISTTVLHDSTLAELNSQLMADLKLNAVRQSIKTKDGHVIKYDEYSAMKSKSIIDKIDRVLAKHYGFTDEELDFIINYDIKYRMGRDAGEKDGE